MNFAFEIHHGVKNSLRKINHFKDRFDLKQNKFNETE